MTVFAAAENVLASDPNFALTGTFSPLSGTPAAVRVVPWQQEEVTDVFGAKVRNPGRGFKIPQADLPTRPRKGDRLTVGVTTYTCKADAAGDLEGTEWTLDVDGGAQ